MPGGSADGRRQRDHQSSPPLAAGATLLPGGASELVAVAVAWMAAAWCVVFAAVTVWPQFAVQAGGSLAAHPVGIAVLNLSAVACNLVGVAVALATVQRWGLRLPTPLVTVAVTGAAGLLLLYGGGVLAFLMVTGRLGDVGPLADGAVRVPFWGYATFFVAGGLAFAVAAWDHQRRAGTPWRWLVVAAVGAPSLLAACS